MIFDQHDPCIYYILVCNSICRERFVLKFWVVDAFGNIVRVQTVHDVDDVDDRGGDVGKCWVKL